MNNKFYYTYVLISQKDGKYYIGSTSDLRRRLRFHNFGTTVSTKARRPFELIYYEACLNKNNAEKRERYFKTGFGRGFLKERIEGP